MPRAPRVESSNARNALFAVYMRRHEKKAREAENRCEASSREGKGKVHSKSHEKRNSVRRSDKTKQAPEHYNVPPEDTSPESSRGSSPQTPANEYVNLHVNVEHTVPMVYGQASSKITPQSILYEGFVTPEFPMVYDRLFPNDSQVPGNVVELLGLQGLGLERPLLEECGPSVFGPQMSQTQASESKFEEMFKAYIDEDAYDEKPSA